MISCIKFLKHFKCHSYLGGTPPCSYPKGKQEAIAAASSNRSYHNNREENRKYFACEKKEYLPVSPQGVQAFRYFSSGCDETGDNGVAVKHDLTKEMFYVDVDSSRVGYIDYDRKGELIILKHTFVSKELGGRGIGKILAKEALEYIAKNDLQLEIQCSFIREYVCKNEPKYIKYIRQ